MEMPATQWDVKQEKNWAVMVVEGRLDSFNFDPFCRQLNELVQSGRNRIALDLSGARFLSLPSIKYLTTFAEELEKAGGNFALLAASEKLKRQIDVYATLNPMKVVRNLEQLHNWDPQVSPLRSPAVPSKAHAEV
ncbi:MAG: STAS domain-containing protein [Bdellovibrionales bacterium]